MIDVPIQVKDALREGRLRKNYRFQVLNEDNSVDFTIDNNNLVSESVIIDERMCSGDTIKFGLCEGSSLEFQYFGKENITGRQLKVFVDVEYGGSTPYSIPMGYFTVKNCSRQASTGIIKVSAYNKLKSDYLDQKANESIIEIANEGILGASQTVNIGLILDDLLQGYSIDRKLKYLDLNNEELTWQYTPARSSESAYSRIHNGVSYYLHILTVTIFFTPSDYNADNIYRCKMFCDLLYSRNKDFIPSELQSTSYLYQGTITSRSDTLINFFDCVYSESHGVARISPGDISASMYCGDGTWIYCNRHKDEFDAVVSDWRINAANSFYISVPIYFLENTESSHTWTQSEINLAQERMWNLFVFSVSYAYFEESAQSQLEKNLVTYNDVLEWPDVTLRELQSAIFEQNCQFGQLDRQTDLFFGADLNQSKLLPQESLYPASNLYPGGAAESAFRSQYSKLWADEGNVRKWRYLIITYKGLDENQQEKDFTLQRTVNADGTDDYNCSDNWLFRNLIWTATDIGSYADAMVLKMRDITWFPFEMWCAGLPYLETGDEIEIPLGEDTYTSYILQRQLKGIQNLQDTYINGTLDIF